MLLKTLKNKTSKIAFNKASETVLNPHNIIREDGFAQQNFICKWERSGHPDTADEFIIVTGHTIFFAHFQIKFFKVRLQGLEKEI